MSADPYRILGVPLSASAEEIRDAYRKLAKKYHPDLNPGNKEAEKKFREINNANELLSDPEKKAKFDRGEIDASGAPVYPQSGYDEASQRGPYYYETQQDGGRYASAFEGFGPELFEELFRRQGKQGAQQFQQPDEHYKLEVDFKTSILGAEQDMVLPTGRTIKVRIPAGVESGKRLRLKGMAGGPKGSAHPGDVYIEIRVRPSGLFSRSGKNLNIEIPITIYEAVLGGDILIPTLEKPIMLKIPKGSNTGTKLKVKGKGVGAPKESDRGDLLVTLKVVMPPTIDNELEEAIRTWNRSHSYNPRAHLEKEGGAS